MCEFYDNITYKFVLNCYMFLFPSILHKHKNKIEPLITKKIFPPTVLNITCKNKVKEKKTLFAVQEAQMFLHVKSFKNKLMINVILFMFLSLDI